MDKTTTRIALCGAGALGSWIGLFLARPEIEFLIVDDDRVEEVNVPVSAFHRRQVGKRKVMALAELMWLKERCCTQTLMMTLKPGNVKAIGKFIPNLIIDAFDNVDSRALLTYFRLPGVPTLHVGVSADHSGIAIWDEHYTLPEGPPRGEDPFCTHHAGRAIIRMTAAVAAGVVERWMSEGKRESVVVMENGVRITGGATAT